MVKSKLHQRMWQVGILAMLLLSAGCGSPLQQGPATTGPGAIQPTVMIVPARTPQPNQSDPPAHAIFPTMTPNLENIPHATDSRTITIQGTVVAPNGMPINGAVIDLDPLTTNGKPFEVIAVVSDEQGQYTWPVQPGRYRMTVTAIGYQPVTQEVIAVGQSVQITTTLATD